MLRVGVLASCNSLPNFTLSPFPLELRRPLHLLTERLARYSYLYFHIYCHLHFSETPPSPPQVCKKLTLGLFYYTPFTSPCNSTTIPLHASVHSSSDYQESNYTTWKLDFYLLSLTFSSLVMFFVLLISVISFVRMLFIFISWSFTLYLTVTFSVLLCIKLTNN